VLSPGLRKCWIKSNKVGGKKETDRITGSCPVPAPPTPSTVSVDVHVDVTRAVATVSDRFVSYDLDWWLPDEGCRPEGWGPKANILEVDLASPKLRALTAALGPAILRIGGSLDKEVVYGEGISGRKCGSGAPAPAPSAGAGLGLHPSCLNASRWDQLHDFVSATDSQLVFGLSYPATGQHIGVANLDQAEALFRYSQSKGYTANSSLFGFELGEEVQHETRPWPLTALALPLCSTHALKRTHTEARLPLPPSVWRGGEARATPRPLTRSRSSALHRATATH
jgi:hypothetical protein